MEINSEACLIVDVSNLFFNKFNFYRPSSFLQISKLEPIPFVPWYYQKLPFK